MKETQKRLLETIRAGIIGDDEAVETPYGLRRVNYADYTASGRSIAFIEDLIRIEVIALYATEFRSRHRIEPESALRGYLMEADTILAEALQSYKEGAVVYAVDEMIDDDFDGLRWFALPWEVLGELGGNPIVTNMSAEGPKIAEIVK